MLIFTVLSKKVYNLLLKALENLDILAVAWKFAQKDSTLEIFQIQFC